MNAYDGTLTFYVVDPTRPADPGVGEGVPGPVHPGARRPRRCGALPVPGEHVAGAGQQFQRYHVTRRRRRSTATSGCGRSPKALPPCSQGDGTRRERCVRTTCCRSSPGPTRSSSCCSNRSAREPAEHGGVHRGRIRHSGSGTARSGRLRKLTTSSSRPARTWTGPGPGAEPDQPGSDGVRQQITLLNQQGSNVLFGDLLIVPIEDSFLYVQPIFVQVVGERRSRS